MKKAIQFMLLAALVVSVSGCANTNHPQAIRESSDIEALRSEIDENAVPKETLTDSFSESKTSSDDSVIDVKAETESSQAETPQPTAEQSPALGIRAGWAYSQTISTMRVSAGIFALMKAAYLPITAMCVQMVVDLLTSTTARLRISPKNTVSKVQSYMNAPLSGERKKIWSDNLHI